MESAKEQMRLRLVLGKFRVTDVTQTLSGQVMKVALGGSTTMTAPLPDRADIQIGDLLTLYTEVLLKEQNHAITLPPPVQ